MYILYIYCISLTLMYNVYIVYIVGPVTSIACPPAPDDIAIIMYTSGSSGKPKVCTLYNHYYKLA